MKIYRKRLALLLITALTVSNLTSVFASEPDMVTSDTYRYRIIRSFEDMSGNFTEEVSDHVSSGNMVTVSPDVYEGFVTPEPVSADISVEPDITLRYERNRHSVLINAFIDGKEFSDPGSLISINGIRYVSENIYRQGESLSLEFVPGLSVDSLKADGEDIKERHIIMPDRDICVSLLGSMIKPSVSDDLISDNEADLDKDVLSSDSISSDTIPSDTVSSDNAGDAEEPDDIPVVVSSDTVSSDTVSDNEPSATPISKDPVPSGLNASRIMAYIDGSVISSDIVPKSDGNSYIVETSSTHSLTVIKGQKMSPLRTDAWETSDKAVATVNASGRITGKALGTVKIRRFGELDTEFTVTIIDSKSLPKNTAGYVSGDIVTIGKGKSFMPALTDKWESADKAVASVTNKGVIQGRKAGETTVTVTGTHNRTFKVKVEDPEVLIKNKTLCIGIGNTVELKDRLIKSDVPLMYSIKNPTIARVDMSGRLTALRTGSTKLYANANGRVYTFTLKVTNNTVSGGMVNALEVYLLPGKSFSLKTAFPKGEVKKLVTYSIPKGDVLTLANGIITYTDAVASVTERGRVTGVADGVTYVVVNIGGVDRYNVKIIVEGEKANIPDEVTLNVNDCFAISTDGITQQVIWSSSNKNIATVNEYGVIKGIKKGKAKISGSISGKKYSITVNVVNSGAKKQYEPVYDYEEVVSGGDAVNPMIIRQFDKNGDWKEIEAWRITYDLSGGSALNPLRYTASDSFTLNNPKRPDSDFLGWTGSNGNVPQLKVSISSNSRGHRHYKAVYKDSPVYKTVTFDTQGGSSVSSVDVESGKPVSRPSDPVKEGYALKGWALLGQEYDFSRPVSSNITLTAWWAPCSYTVTLNKNSSDAGSTQGTVSVTAIYDSEMPPTFAVVPTRTGYTFTGYYDTVSGGIRYYNADRSSARVWDKAYPTTLYAGWEANRYAVTLNANGGMGGSPSVKAVYGSDMPSGYLAPSWGGHTFLGFFDASSGGTQYYSSVMKSVKQWDKTSPATLYAQWAVI